MKDIRKPGMQSILVTQSVADFEPAAMRLMMTDGPRSGPPQIETIVNDAVGRTDVGYTLRVHMHGLRGIWHRLWAIIVTADMLGDEGMQTGVAEVRAQLERQLGRAMTADEWAKLEAHAKAHAKRLAGQS